MNFPASASLAHFKDYTYRYEFRMIVALTSVLSVSYLLKLHSPHWSAITLWVVSQPSRGTTLMKSWYRLLGTLIGGAVGIGIVSCLNSSILLISFALAAWIALCSYASHRLSYLKSYGAVLAALTAALLALVVIEEGTEVYHLAVSRLANVGLGVTAGAIFSFWPGSASNKQQLLDKLRDTLKLFEGVYQSAHRITLKDLNDQLIALDEALVYARLESAEVRLKYRLFQNLILHLFRCVSEYLKWEEYRKNSDNSLSQTRYEESRLRYRNELNWAQAVSQKALPDQIGGLDHSSEIHFTDLRSAHYSALRSFVGVMVGGLIWSFTGWKLSAGIILIAALNCVLFASRPDPKAGMTTTIKSSLTSYLAAGMALFLYDSTGSVLWILLLSSVVLLISASRMILPSTALSGSIMGSNFLLFLAPHWPFSISWPNYFNLGVGYFAGSTVSWLLFQIVAPPSQVQQVFSIRKRGWIDFFTLLDSRFVSRQRTFESATYSKFSRLMQITIQSQSGSTQVVRELFILLQIWMAYSEVMNKASISSSVADTQANFKKSNHQLVTADSKIHRTLHVCSENWRNETKKLLNHSPIADIEVSDRSNFDSIILEWLDMSSKEWSEVPQLTQLFQELKNCVKN